MKQAVSISIGSSKRDKTVEISLLGEKVRLQRIGTDGDMQKAADLFRQLDGKVDAFGLGGTDLGLRVAERWYPLYSILPLIKDVHITPIADGTGLKTTLEAAAAQILSEKLSGQIKEKKALVTTAVDRWGLASSFINEGYDCVFGDLFFSLGLPIPIRTTSSVKLLARILMPIMGRIPFRWLYPVGEAQEKRTPKQEKFFQWAQVVAGDCHYITRYMPERLENKIIVTNTTTPADVKLFKDAGIHYLVTTTPVLDGRSFGTNMMEAGILAAIGRKEPINYAQPGNYFEELGEIVKKMKMSPQVQEI